jgi:chromosome segregation ATPase
MRCAAKIIFKNLWLDRDYCIGALMSLLATSTSSSDTILSLDIHDDAQEAATGAESRLAQDIELLTQQLDALVGSNDVMLDENSGLKDENSELNDRLKALGDANEKLRCEYGVLKRSYEELDDELDGMHTVKSMESERKRTHRRRRDQTIQNQNRELDDLERREAEIVRTRDLAAAQCQNATARGDELISAYEEMRNQLNTTRIQQLQIANDAIARVENEKTMLNFMIQGNGRQYQGNGSGCVTM